MTLYIFENTNGTFGYSTVDNPISIELGDRRAANTNSWELVDEIDEDSEAEDLAEYFEGAALQKAAQIFAAGISKVTNETHGGDQ